MSAEIAHSQDVVTAVIVAHDGAAWVPQVAHAVASQRRPVQRVVAVDTGSRDRSGAMLAQAFGRGAVFGMERGTGYGAAVSHALRHRAANTHVQPAGGPSGERTEWIWLLHDDCEPAPGALEQLLLAAARSPSAAVLGPKVLDWSDRTVLLEAGITIDRAGRRITGIEPREVDQGQHDGDRDVLAVSSAGMLVRRDVWDQVHGFDPGMKLFREDVDFCWRVQAAGYRVRVVTDAVVYHVEASARNRRPTSAAPHRRREERRNGLTALLGNLPRGPMLAALAGNLVLSFLRTLFFLLAKRPVAALDEFTAYMTVGGHPVRLAAARRHRARGRQNVYPRLRAEVPPGRSVRKLAEFLTGALSKSLPVDTVGSHHASEDPSEDDSLLVDSGLVQRLLTSPGVLLFLGLTVVALVAERSLLGSNPLGGGALVPAWGGVSGLWQEYLQGFHPAGIGSTAATPPYVAVIALLATVLGGKPWLAVDVLLLGCVPLAGMTAFLAAGGITRFVPARLWAAATYALLPVGMGAVAAGRLGTAVVLVLLPLAALLAGRAFSAGPRRARRAAWATALLVAVAAAFVPLVWLLAVVAMAVGVLAFGRRPAAALNAAIIAAVPVILLMPWALGLFSHPAQFFLEAGQPRPGLASASLAPRSLLLLSPGGPGLPPFWVTTGLALAAAIALVASGRRALVLAGWGVAAIGLVAGAAVSRIAVTPAGAAASIAAWPGAALAVAGTGLLIAAAAAGETLPGRLRGGRWRGPAGMGVLLVALVAGSAPLAAAAAWVVSGVNGPVAPAHGPLLPEFVSVSSSNGLQPRTLVLQTGPDGGIDYTVLRGSDPMIGSGELAFPPSGQRVLNLTVAALTAPHGGDVTDQGRALAGLGIGYVLLPSPVSPALARLLDGVAGLRPVSDTGAFQLWRVVDPSGRLTVVGPSGSVTPLPSGQVNAAGVKAPPAGGTLVLAEPAGGWNATLNGHPLTPLASPVDGWAQGFRLPAGGGTLSVGRDQLSRYLTVGLEAIAFLVVAGLGLPGARLAGEEQDAAAVRGGRASGGAPGDGRAGEGRTGDEAGDEDEAGLGRRGRRGRAAPGGEVPAGAGARAAAAAAGPGAGRPGAGGPGAGGPGAGRSGAGVAGAGLAAGPGGAGPGGALAGEAGVAGPGVPQPRGSRLRSAAAAGARAGFRRRGGDAAGGPPDAGPSGAGPSGAGPARAGQPPAGAPGGDPPYGDSPYGDEAYQDAAYGGADRPAGPRRFLGGRRGQGQPAGPGGPGGPGPGPSGPGPGPSGLGPGPGGYPGDEKHSGDGGYRSDGGYPGEPGYRGRPGGPAYQGGPGYGDGPGYRQGTDPRGRRAAGGPGPGSAGYRSSAPPGYGPGGQTEHGSGERPAYRPDGPPGYGQDQPGYGDADTPGRGLARRGPEGSPEYGGPGYGPPEQGGYRGGRRRQDPAAAADGPQAGYRPGRRRAASPDDAAGPGEPGYGPGQGPGGEQGRRRRGRAGTGPQPGGLDRLVDTGPPGRSDEWRRAAAGLPPYAAASPDRAPHEPGAQDSMPYGAAYDPAAEDQAVRGRAPADPSGTRGSGGYDTAPPARGGGPAGGASGAYGPSGTYGPGGGFDRPAPGDRGNHPYDPAATGPRARYGAGPTQQDSYGSQPGPGYPPAHEGGAPGPGGERAPRPAGGRPEGGRRGRRARSGPGDHGPDDSGYPPAQVGPGYGREPDDHGYRADSGAPGGSSYDYGSGPGGAAYGPSPGGSVGQGYERGPAAAAGPGYERGPGDAGGPGYGPGPRQAGRGGSGDTGPRPYPSGSYDTGPYDTGSHPSGPYPADSHPSGPYPAGAYRPGAGGRPGPAPGQEGPAGDAAPAREGRRGRGRWLGRGSGGGGQDQRSAPPDPLARRPGGGGLSPLPPLPQRSGRPHQFGDEPSPGDGPPGDWGRDDYPDQEEPDW